jgi:hypothetical protein
MECLKKQWIKDTKEQVSQALLGMRTKFDTERQMLINKIQDLSNQLNGGDSKISLAKPGVIQKWSLEDK